MPTVLYKDQYVLKYEHLGRNWHGTITSPNDEPPFPEPHILVTEAEGERGLIERARARIDENIAQRKQRS